MADILQKQDVLDGKKLICTLDFSQYSASKFKSDFMEYIAYQNIQGKRSAEDNDLKVYKKIIYAEGDIDYAYFKQNSISYFHECIAQMCKQNPSMMASDTGSFELRIIIKRIKDRSFYFEYNDEDSDDGFASYNGAGIWFIESIVAPLFYLKRIDYGIIVRYFAHELTHHFDKLKGYLDIERKYSKQIRKLTNDNSTYAINLLFTSIVNLRDEGFADFNARLSGPTQEMNMNAIKVYNANIEKLCTYRSRYRSTLFYAKNIGWENLTPTGENSIGRYLCLTITVYMAMLQKQPFELKVNGNMITSNDLMSKRFNLNSLMRENDLLVFSGFTSKTINEASKAIGSTQGVDFLGLYERACKFLKIKSRI
jgi:hypothetical protein